MEDGTRTEELSADARRLEGNRIIMGLGASVAHSPGWIHLLEHRGLEWSIGIAMRLAIGAALAHPEWAKGVLSAVSTPATEASEPLAIEGLVRAVPVSMALPLQTELDR